MTTLTQPIAKLYKRCARKHHDDCPGHFDYTNGQVYSVCSCDCHAANVEWLAAQLQEFAPVSCEDKADAVAEAVAITTPAVVTPRPIKPAAKTRKVSPAKPIEDRNVISRASGLAYATVKDDGKNRNARGGRKVTSPGVKRSTWEGNLLGAGVGFPTPVLKDTMADVLGRCPGCGIVLREEYGKFGSRCNECNVKAGIMRYYNRYSYGRDYHTDGVDLALVLPMTRETFDAMLAINSNLNPWKER